MSSENDLGWVPAGGAHLNHGDLIEVLHALRALIDGTNPDEPNRAHAVTIAYTLSEAIDRSGDSDE